MATSSKTSELLDKLRELDADVAKFRNTLEAQLSDDAQDHLHYVHLLLTSAKGHLGAVRHALKNNELRS